MEEREPIRMQLEGGITAQLDWQPNQPKPFWSFGFIHDELVGTDEPPYQPCMLGSVEPDGLIFRGIARYQLPKPLAADDKRAFEAWVSETDMPYVDGDMCPHCSSVNTERIDVVNDDPVVWVCECGGCGEMFEVLIPPEAASGN
jgi:hypothetical protein